MRGACFRITMALAIIAAGPCFASDHADPTWIANNRQEANLTGLFFFPVGERYVAILDTRPTLTAQPPYKLRPYRFTINIDTHSAVRFPPEPPPPAPGEPPAPPLRPSAEQQALSGDLARYGGTVADPGAIASDVSFAFVLEDDATVRPENVHITGLKPLPIKVFSDRDLWQLRQRPQDYANDILVYAGVRDDPFIFPRFFNANIVTMVVSVPKSAFQTTNPDWLLWGVSSFAKSGKQIDHVGRSNRTQLARFDVLNTEPPSRHVRVLRKVAALRIKAQDFFKDVLRPVSNLNQLSGFLLRGYDYAPDVMIFTSRRPPGFPNGRRLEDDVAKITCDWGDCPLQENSYIDARTFPRAVVNDKPFLTQFPYLAEPWPWRPQPVVGSPWTWFRAHLLWPLVAIVTALLALHLYRRRLCARLRAARA